MFEINVNGFVEVIRNIERLQERYDKMVKKALLENGFHLLNKAIDITPIDTGNLRGSGVVVSNDQIYAEGNANGGIDINSTVIRNGSQVRHVLKVTVGFNTHYALKVHEWTDPEPNWSDPNTGPKFLERPLEEFARQYHKNIQKAIEKALGGG